jgi:Pro-Pro endopeptidase
MRRLISLIAMISLITPLLSFSPYSPVQGILLKNYPKLSHLENSLEKFEPLKEIVILPEEDFDENEAIKIISTLANINENILKKMVNQRVYVKLFTGELTDEPSALYLKGKIPRGYMFSNVTWDDVPGLGGTRIVLVKLGHSEQGKGHGSINLELHEVAHSVDQIVFNGIHSKPDFLKIWRKEANRLFPGNWYFINYPEEYFAETFAYYYYNHETREYLRTVAPLTYEYMKSLEK